MDPNKTLKELRDLISIWRVSTLIWSEEDLIEFGDDFSSKFEALDKWLKNKGFKPNDWQ